jgi:hypothetical protein
MYQADPSARIIKNHASFECGIKRIVVAYHRQRNLKNIRAPRRLNPEGTQVYKSVIVEICLLTGTRGRPADKAYACLSTSEICLQQRKSILTAKLKNVF